MSDTELLQSERVEEPPATPPEQTPPPAAPVDEEAQLDAELEAQAIDIPDGEKLVPLSAVTGVRGKLKDAKSTAAAAKAEADAAKQQAATLQAWVEQARPWIESAQALAAARAAGQQPQQPVDVKPQDDPELVELARTLDLYAPDGTPDAAKAAKLMSVMDKRAGKIAQEQVQPFAQQTAEQQSAYNLGRAKNTAVNGQKADPAVLDALWSRMDPAATANSETAKWLLTVAMGLGVMGGKQQQPATQPGAQRGPDGKFLPTQPQVPDPLYTERAGGQAPLTVTNLTDAEKKVAREMFGDAKDPSGIAAYIKQASTMPKDWGKGR